MKKRIMSILLAIFIAFAVLPVAAKAAGTLSNFSKKNTYQSGQFSDVSNEWFAQYVQAAYEMGLMGGTSPGEFSPGRNLTLAEALKLAACLHSIYNTGAATFASGSPWYQPYVDYALEKGIISSPYPDYKANATRSDFALIFANALPGEALTVKNAIDDNRIPDVNLSFSYGPAVYKLYRAGVLTGSDSAGNFFPNSYITRDSVAAIAARMANPSFRQTVSLTAPSKELSAAEIAAKCSPAVFYIEVYDKDGKAFASGSGFFISSSGVAVTNYHVIDGAASAKIMTVDKKTYDVTGAYDVSKANDLALLQIGGTGFPFLETGDSSAIVAGQKIFAIGSPKGLDNTISDGIISNVSRVVNGTTMFQISAPISPGSSGGALLDAQGKVIGVTAATKGDAQNLNFAIPIKLLQGLKRDSVVPLSSVAPSAPALTITPSQTAVSVPVGGQATITLTASSDAFVTFGIDIVDKSIISRTWGSRSGNSVPVTITGLSAGSTILYAALLDKDGKALSEAKINVTVTHAESTLTITASPTTVSVPVGGQATVTCTASPGGFDSIGYIREDKTLVTCAWGDWSGNSIPLTITGIATGTTKIHVGLVDKDKNLLVETIINVTVTQAKPTLTITASPAAVSVAKGAQATVTVYASSLDFNDIVYLSDNDSIFKAEKGKWNGNYCSIRITGVAAGSAAIQLILIDAANNKLASTTVNLTVTSNSPTIYYPGTTIPDWGAFTGTPLYDKTDYMLAQYHTTSYFYRMSDVKVGTEIGLDQYYKELVNVGFSYDSSLTSYDGYTFIVYIKDATSVSIGLIKRNGILCMDISVITGFKDKE